MIQNDKLSAFLLGAFIFCGLAALGYLLGNAAVSVKQYDRSVAVKGLSEREYPADIVIWPIQFTAADNDLEKLYVTIEDSTAKIKAFLAANGIKAEDISVSSPAIRDKSADQYGNGGESPFRYTAAQTVTVYSADIDQVRAVMGSLSNLGKQGIVITGGNYEQRTEYLFNRLNEVKPAMIEEATRNAREVAEKFAADSRSTLGKIKMASQGQFTISDRDANNPHIKKVRVVSTVEYYLAD